MAQRHVIVCDRCGSEDTRVGDNFKTVDLPNFHQGGRDPTPDRRKFDLCGDCYYALGQMLRHFLDNVNFRLERK